MRRSIFFTAVLCIGFLCGTTDRLEATNYCYGSTEIFKSDGYAQCHAMTELDGSSGYYYDAFVEVSIYREDGLVTGYPPASNTGSYSAEVYTGALLEPGHWYCGEGTHGVRIYFYDYYCGGYYDAFGYSAHVPENPPEPRWWWIPIGAVFYVGWYYAEQGSTQDAFAEPKVEILSADLEADRIDVRLLPESVAGLLLLKLRGDHDCLISITQEVGSRTTIRKPFWPIEDMPIGYFLRVEATWTLAGTSAAAWAPYDFPPGKRMHVLGDWTNTRYNTPTESFCSGSLVDGQYTSGDCVYVSSCTFTAFQGKSGWWPEVIENGSGVSQNIGTVSREWHCTGAGNRVRAVPAPCPQCSGGGLSVGSTVARNASNENVPCGARLYVRGVGTVTVTDAGGQLALNQLDHYAGASGCNRTAGTIGVRKVIRLF